MEYSVMQEPGLAGVHSYMVFLPVNEWLFFSLLSNIFVHYYKKTFDTSLIVLLLHKLKEAHPSFIYMRLQRK